MSLASIDLVDALAAVMLLSLVAYAWFAGADFGAGFWDLTSRGPRSAERRELIARAIGPVWEANHVWLIIVVVLLFTGFPEAFSTIMTALHVPLSLMLFMIVLRGSAFTFRSYDTDESSKHRWNRVFSIPSVATPLLLGMIFGAIASGGLPRKLESIPDLFLPWLRPFPIAVGFFALAIFAYLAAVYLTLETDEESLQEDFRRRALGAAVVVGALAWLVYLLAKSGAPLVFQGLDHLAWGLPTRIATGVCAVGALLALTFRFYHVARIAAMLQVALILIGCGMAQYPYIIPPSLTLHECAAPASVLQALLIAVAAGSVVLIPSLIYLFRIFKGHTLNKRRFEFSRLRRRAGRLDSKP